MRDAGREVTLTHFEAVLARPGGDQGDLLQYYVNMAPALCLTRDRAMVMKRYPHGADGAFFFMKRAPCSRPPRIETCAIEHDSGNVIDFPMIQDLASLLWVVNLGCIDLNQWYARCDDVDRPDYLHFDLDPVDGHALAQVRETALVLREASRAGNAQLSRRPLDPRVSTFTSRSCAVQCRRRSGPWRRPWPRLWSKPAPT